MVFKWTIDYPAYTGTEERFVYVYLPDYYEEEPDMHFPVLYAFDGHNLFFDEDATYGKSWGLGDYLDSVQAPIIVAAIECNHGPDNARLSEYAPFSFTEEGFGYVEKHGDMTMDFIVHEFKPFIDSCFRTLPDREHTFIMGSSMGAVMAIYGVLEYQPFFSKAAALSPALEIGFDHLLSMAREAGFADSGTEVYMDYGEEEYDMYPGADKDYRKLAVALMERGIMLTSRIVPHGAHCEASWERQLPFVFETLLYDLEDE